MHRRVVRVVAVAVATVAAGIGTPAAASAAPSTTGAATFGAGPAVITPGVRMLTPVSRTVAASCTAAFVFQGRGGAYLGYAAHCAAENADPSRSGCAESPLPIGSPVTIVGRDGSRSLGHLAYSSWRTMKARHETDEDLCSYNDFALVAIEPRDTDRVDPTVPQLGGPTGLDVDGTTQGEPVVSYQPNNPGPEIKQGTSLGDAGGGRTHRVRTSPAGDPGDSGGGYLDAQGRAFGVLSTQFLDAYASNGVGDLADEMSYASRFGGLGTIALVRGTEPFREPSTRQP